MIISNQRGLYPVKNNNKLFSSCSKKEIIGGKNIGCFYHFLNKICNFGFQETLKNHTRLSEIIWNQINWTI